MNSIFSLFIIIIFFFAFCNLGSHFFQTQETMNVTLSSKYNFEELKYDWHLYLIDFLSKYVNSKK